ncbi:MAG: TRAP transporter substrate-binding protein [Rhodovarius sp.]|nr:TRAP transporter substrate-binding protein [Rhodovarius sp.]MCX7931170.1 TRAP transporter substrate-binding protein [Rhodovarius sp.]MDW8313435.1 TRAP transporter substrate-binding protein [Rhodovarius sp.]
MIARRSMLGALLAAGAASPGAMAQHRWQAASGFAEGNYHTRNLRLFLEEVRVATGGALDIQLHSNGSLLPQPQIKRGVQQGQVQLGEILLTAYANEDPIFDLDQVPGVVSSMADAQRLMAVRGPAIEQRLARQGMHLLYLAPWPLVGLASQAPVNDAAAFRGLRLRTYSPISTRFAQLMGATAVLLPAPEVAQGFATGIVNAQLTTAPVAADTQAWDVTRVFTRLNLATSNNAVFVNRRAFDALPEAHREALRVAARRAAERAWAMAEEADAAALARMRERGMQVLDVSPALAEALREPSRILTEDWLARAGAEGRALLEAYRARA